MKAATEEKNNRFDPRVKIAWLLTGVGMVVWRQDIPHLCFTFMIVLLLNQWSGLSIKRITSFLKITGLIGLQLLILQGFIQHEGTKLFIVVGLPFYSGGLLVGLRGILVVLCLALLFFQFLFWTRPKEITLLLLKLRVPFHYAFIAGLAARYWPLLEQDLRFIYQSQLSRGLRLDGFFRKVRGLPPIILPLILRTLRRAEAIALSMELKGFGRSPRVTQLAELRWRPKDYWALLGILAYGLLLGLGV